MTEPSAVHIEHDGKRTQKLAIGGLDLVRILAYEVDKIVFMSGRDEVCRDETLAWLNRYEVFGNFSARVAADELHMRPHKDNRGDDLIKYELYLKHVEPFYTVRYVLDDRDRVVAMWRRLGLTVLQVAEGNF